MGAGRPETVTVVFTDLVGSTAWRVRVGDEVADARTAELGRASRDVVESAGGTIVKSTGDGVMATFASAATALDAAAALQAVAGRLAIGDTRACLRVGVSTGDMVRDGDDWLGVAAIEASRLCAEAAGGSTLVADATARLSRGRTSHSLRLLGARTLRGFDEPLDVYELVLERPGGETLPPALVREAASPLIGRSAELDRAGALLDAVAAGDPRTLFLVGEPGIGKTRLAAAIAADALTRGFLVLHGRCDEGLAAPFQPIIQAFEPWLMDCPPAALERTLGAGGADLVHLWPALAGRLDVSATPPELDPELRRWRTFEAVVHMVRSAAAERRLLLIVDDLQWAETSTLQLLAHIVNHAVPATALTCTVRTGGRDPSTLLGDLGSGREIELLHLDGLEAEAVAELVAVRAGDRPPDDLSAELRRYTDGNPFFLTSLLAHLHEVAHVRTNAGTWVTAAELDAVSVPTGVRGVITRRLSGLGDAARRVLEVGAVSGLSFSERIVRGVLGTATDGNVDALESAVAAALVREEGPGRFGFAHALVRHAVLDGLSRTRLARLHWRIAEALERDDPSRVGEIAVHFAAGREVGDEPTVARASLAAGDDAMQRVAFAEAADHYRIALDALERTAPDPRRRFRALCSLGQALNALAEPTAAEPAWLEAAEIARQAGDAEGLFTALTGYGYVIRVSDDADIVGLLDGLLQIVGPEDSPVRACALGWRAMPISRVGVSRPMPGDLGAADEAVAMARRTGDISALASTLGSRLQLEAQTPDAVAMLRDAEELVALGDAGRPRSWALYDGAVRGLVRALLRLGRRTEAEQRLAGANDTAHRSGHRMAVHDVFVVQSALASASGRFFDGKRLAADAARWGGRQARQVELMYAAQVHATRMEQGRLQEVVSGLRSLKGFGTPLRAWWAMLAGALADAGHLEEAQAELGRVIDDEPLGYPRDFAVSLTIRHVCEVCRQVGDRTRATALLPHVAPWTNQLLVVAGGLSIEGAADRAIGHLLATLGRFDEALVAYTAAAELEHSAGFPPLAARTEYWHARALLERDAPGDAERADALLGGVVEVTERLGMTLLAQQATSYRLR